MADVPYNQRIELICPECGHHQVEPALVVATQCRACRNHFQVMDGRSVERARPVTRLASPERLAEITSFKPLAERAPSVIAKPPARKRIGGWLGYLLGHRPDREVICFKCATTARAIAAAQSSQCPKCGAYISLQDFEIEGIWNRKIRTRGRVRIQKTGVARTALIECHEMTVLGELAAPVECSGSLEFRSSGRVSGSIHCRKLVVGRGTTIEFLHPVVADSARIAGTVRGQITCRTKITLERGARLHGLVRTASFIKKKGARHSGTIEILPKSGA